MCGNSELSNNKERIQQLLESSFRKSGAAKSHVLTHTELRELRSNIALLRFEDLQAYLPQILCDLMEEHADDLLDKKDIHFVIAHLNVPGTSNRTLLGETIGEDHNQFAQQNDEYLGKAMSELYAQFTKDQCKAIYEWLRFVSTLRLLRSFSRGLSSSLAYWSGRAHGHSAE